MHRITIQGKSSWWRQNQSYSITSSLKFTPSIWNTVCIFLASIFNIKVNLYFWKNGGIFLLCFRNEHLLILKVGCHCRQAQAKGDWGQIFFCFVCTFEGIFFDCSLSLWVNITKNQCWMSWGCMQQESTIKGEWWQTFFLLLSLCWTRVRLIIRNWFHGVFWVKTKTYFVNVIP